MQKGTCIHSQESCIKDIVIILLEHCLQKEINSALPTMFLLSMKYKTVNSNTDEN